MGGAVPQEHYRGTLCVPGTRRRASVWICGGNRLGRARNSWDLSLPRGSRVLAVFPQRVLSCVFLTSLSLGYLTPSSLRSLRGGGGAPPPALCSGEAGPRQLLPLWWPRKQDLTQGRGPQGLSSVPTLTPETLCPFAIQEASLRGRPVAGFQKRQPVFRMALSAVEQGWLEGWVC